MQVPFGRNEKTEPSKRVLWYVGLLVYVATGLVYLVGGLFFVPGLWLVPIWGGWLVGLWVAYRLMLRRSYWVVAAVPVALVVLWAYVTVGWAMWGWAVEDLPFGVR